MICNNCQHEIEDNINFCPYCGMSFGKENTKNKSLILIIFSIILVILLAFGTYYTLKSPEYTIYQTCVSIKNHNYDKTIEYLNIDKIVDNRLESVKDEMSNDPELKNNPFAGLAYMFVDAFSARFKDAINAALKDIVNSNDNVFTEISNVKLIYFLIVKSYNGATLSKAQTGDNQVTFTLKDTDENNSYNVDLVLDKTNKKHYEIVDINGYNFWDDYLKE